MKNCKNCLWQPEDKCLVFKDKDNNFNKDLECQAKITDKKQFLHKIINTSRKVDRKKLMDFIYSEIL